MYEPQISDYSERSARWVTPSANAKRLSYDELIAKVSAVSPEARPAMIMIKADLEHRSASTSDETIPFSSIRTTVRFSAGNPRRTIDIIDWHRWLGVEGEGRATARAITGACNLAFFWLQP
jgi:hypothetical protein